MENLRSEGGDGKLRGKELISAVSALARTNPSEALRLFSEPLDPDRNENWIGFSEVAEIICRSNPELMVDWMTQKLPEMTNRQVASLYLRQGFAQLGAFSPATAVDSLKGMPLSDVDMRVAVTAVFGGMGEGDPTLAEQRLSELDPKYRQKALHSLAESSGKKSPEKGLELAAKLEDPTLRNSASSEIYANWVEIDPALASSSFKALDPLQRQKLLEGDASSAGSLTAGSLMGKLAEKDPDLLLDLLHETYPSALNRRVFETSLALTLEKNPARTFETIGKLPAGNLKNRLAEEAYSKLARTDLNKSLETLLQTSDPTLRANGLKGVASSLGEGGLEKTLAQASKFSEAERSTILAGAFSSIAYNDLDAAANYLTDLDSAPVKIAASAKGEIYEEVGERLATRDLDRAKQWMTNLPEGEQARAMRGIASGMARQDINSLGNYLNSVSQDKLWAEGVRVMIASVRDGDPEMAETWKSALKKAGY